MSPYAERLVDRLHDAEEDLKREVKASSADGSIEFTAAGCGSTRSFERRIGGCARAFPHTSLKATSSVF